MSEQPQDALGGLIDSAAAEAAAEQLTASDDADDPKPMLIKAAARALVSRRWATLQLIAKALECAEMDTIVRGEGKKAWDEWAAKRTADRPAGQPLGKRAAKRDLPCHCGGLVGPHPVGAYGCVGDQ